MSHAVGGHAKLPGEGGSAHAQCVKLLASARCPTLVLGREADHITPVSVQRKIAARYNSEYLEAVGHAHLPMLEPGRERLFADVLSWLARVG